MATIDLAGYGHGEATARSSSFTLAATDSGVVQNCTATLTVTLPAVAAGTSNVTAIIRVGAEGKTITVSPNSADKIVGNGFTAADDKDLVFTNQPAGSYVVLVAANEATTDSAWVVQRILGTATREA